MMNQNVSYGDKQTTWSGILLLKTREISYYLIGKTKELDFVRPEFEFRGLIIWKLGKKFSNFIFGLEKMELSKRTLYYMKQNTKINKPFTLNSHVLGRVKAWENFVSGRDIKT